METLLIAGGLGFLGWLKNRQTESQQYTDYQYYETSPRVLQEPVQYYSTTNTEQPPQETVNLPSNFVPMYGANLTGPSIDKQINMNNLNGTRNEFGPDYYNKREVENTINPAELIHGSPHQYKEYRREYIETVPMEVKNNVLPFEQIRVGPGLGVDEKVAATGGYQQGVRILPVYEMYSENERDMMKPFNSVPGMQTSMQDNLEYGPQYFGDVTHHPKDLSYQRFGIAGGNNEAAMNKDADWGNFCTMRGEAHNMIPGTARKYVPKMNELATTNTQYMTESDMAINRGQQFNQTGQPVGDVPMYSPEQLNGFLLSREDTVTQKNDHYGFVNDYQSLDATNRFRSGELTQELNMRNVVHEDPSKFIGNASGNQRIVSEDAKGFFQVDTQRGQRTAEPTNVATSAPDLGTSRMPDSAYTKKPDKFPHEIFLNGTPGNVGGMTKDNEIQQDQIIYTKSGRGEYVAGPNELSGPAAAVEKYTEMPHKQGWINNNDEMSNQKEALFEQLNNRGPNPMASDLNLPAERNMTSKKTPLENNNDDNINLTRVFERIPQDVVDTNIVNEDAYAAGTNAENASAFANKRVQENSSDTKGQLAQNPFNHDITTPVKKQ